jgi:NTP pyrophosphatase (non-canonical NTP hydrolase)
MAVRDLVRARANAARGEDCRHAKLDSNAVLSIRANIDGLTSKQLADRFGVHCRTIEKVQRFESWGHVMSKTAIQGSFFAETDTASDLYYEIEARIGKAGDRYGDFASTHEALGVAYEEWNELCDAIRSNALGSVEHECLDLAAVLIRLARNLRNSNYTQQRSVK